MLEYTIWAADEEPQTKYMWSLNCDTDHKRQLIPGSPEMIADVQPTGSYLHAFTLLKKSNPEIIAAERNRSLVSVIGRNGNDDLMEGLLGYPVYNRRKLTETFIFLKDGSDEKHITPADHREWPGQASEVSNFLNSHIGQWRITTSDDPGYYWLGRVTASFKPEKYRGILTITADVEPYKYEKFHSCEPRLWDDCTIYDIDRDYGDIRIPANSTVTLPIPVREMDMTPKFKVAEYVSGHPENVQVSIDGTIWCNAAFHDFHVATYVDSRNVVNDFVISGSQTPYTVRNLAIKNNTSTAKHLSVMVRGGSL